MPAPVRVTVPVSGAVLVPEAFVEAARDSAVLAVAAAGTFVPAAASYSTGVDGLAGYAVAVGVPIPETWIPR